MSSTSETGHAKNVANFQDIISFCSGYGTAYNPSNPSLKLAAIQALHTNAQTALDDLKTQKANADKAANLRQLAFKPIKQLATKVVNALASSGADDLIIADAKTINRKIQGKSAPGNTPPTPPPTTPPNTISTSQQSFDSLIDHIQKLVKLVSAESLYTPNETEVQVAALNSFITNLQSANAAVVNANTGYSNALIQRNKLLYSPKTGLVDTALDVKKYVISVFKASSAEYKQISKIKFKNNPGK